MRVTCTLADLIELDPQEVFELDPQELRSMDIRLRQKQRKLENVEYKYRLDYEESFPI